MPWPSQTPAQGNYAEWLFRIADVLDDSSELPETALPGTAYLVLEDPDSEYNPYTLYVWSPVADDFLNLGQLRIDPSDEWVELSTETIAAAETAAASAAEAAGYAEQIAAVFDDTPGSGLDTVGVTTLVALLASNTAARGAGAIWHALSADKVVRRYEEQTAVSADYDLITAGGVKLNVLPEADGFLAVEAFGAVLDGDNADGTTIDGVTDDSDAWLAAFKALRRNFTGVARKPLGGVSFGVGCSMLLTPGVFSSFNSIKYYGLKVKGVSMGASTVWMPPNGAVADQWFYDNDTDNQLWGPVFEDMCFAGGTDWRDAAADDGSAYGYGNIDQYSKGFRISGPGWESAFMFNRCRFKYLKTVFRLDGANNSDTHRLDMCEVHACDDFLIVDNTQAVSFQSYGTYFEQNYGDLITFASGAAGGGGNILISGGDIVQQQWWSVTTMQYLLKATAGGTANNNAPVVFDNVRIELRGNYTGICDIDYGDTQLVMKNCGIHNTGDGDKTVLVVGGYSTVVLDGTSWYNGTEGGRMLVQIGKSGDGRKGKNARLICVGECILPIGWIQYSNNHISWEGNGGRLTISSTCRVGNVSDTSSSPRTYATGCDTFGPDTVPGLGQAQNTRQRTTETFDASPIWNQSNSAGANGLTGAAVRVPPWHSLRELWAFVPPGLGNSNDYRILWGPDDKSEVWASTAVKAQDVGCYVHANVYIPVKDDNNLGTPRCWIDDGAGSASSGDATIRIDAGVKYGA